MKYKIKDKELVWNEDLSDNNLYIEGLWNMKETVGHDECCVLLRMIDDDSFYFATYNGMGYTMKLEEELKCIKKQMTR